MISRWRTALLGGSAIVTLSGAALAQNPPPQRADQSALAQPPYDPQQLPVQHGQCTLTSRGDIDGLIPTDGTEVKTPPHLSTQIAYAIKPGDIVTIHRLHAAALPLVQAVSITDDATKRTVIDNGPPGPGRGPAPSPPAQAKSGASRPFAGLTELQGRVRMVLHGPQGDPNGALLDDGTILRLPPPEAYRFASLLQPGQAVVSEGTEFVTPMVKVLDAQQLGASREQLSVVNTPPGRRPPQPPPGFGPPGPPWP
jgi:hypothetical protein